MRTRAPCAPLEMELARPTAKLRNAWLRARTSLWFVPSLLVLASMVLAEGALYVDDSLGTDQPHAWWFFSGNAQGARTILSTIAGSLVSVIALSFSVTMIAIQQAATQFTPRVLKNFTRDRRNQVVLGVYVATFIYALLVLRRVRESDAQGPGFVPGISISIAMLLALVGLAMLIYFIHHVSESLQVSYLLDAIRRDFDRESARLYPEPLGEGIERDSSRELAGTSAELGGGASDERFHVVRSEEEGYVRDVDGEALIDCARGTAQFVGVDVAVGRTCSGAIPSCACVSSMCPNPSSTAGYSPRWCSIATGRWSKILPTPFNSSSTLPSKRCHPASMIRPRPRRRSIIWGARLRVWRGMNSLRRDAPPRGSSCSWRALISTPTCTRRSIKFGAPHARTSA